MRSPEGIEDAGCFFRGESATPVDHFDTAALILFLAMALWQMPHFYAIAMFRHEDCRLKARFLPQVGNHHGLTAKERVTSL